MRQRVLQTFLVMLAFISLMLLTPTGALGESSTGYPIDSTNAAPASTLSGPQLYADCFEVWKQLDIALVAPSSRNQWQSQWQNHFSQSQLQSIDAAMQACQTMIASLGHRFSHIEPPVMNAVWQSQVDATATGIGIAYHIRGYDTIVSPGHELLIEQVFEAGPGQEAGLLKGDEILAIDGASAEGHSILEISSLVKGETGKHVTLSVRRVDELGQISYLTFEIARREFVIPDVLFEQMADKVSYIKLNDFQSKNAASEMQKAINLIEPNSALLLDLRGNTGGSMSNALDIASMLIEDGPVVETVARNGDYILNERVVLEKGLQLNVIRKFGAIEDNLISESDDIQISLAPRKFKTLPEGTPIIVLVDGSTASASELLAGALQRNGAILLGTPTFGKFEAQSWVELDGYGMFPTTLYFYPGSGQREWFPLIPDVVVESKTQEEDSQLKEGLRIANDCLDKRSHHARIRASRRD